MIKLHSRKCAGAHIAMSTLWITIASILATFKIDKYKDEFGNIVEPVVDFKSAVIVAYVLSPRLYITCSTSFCKLGFHHHLNVQFNLVPQKAKS